MRRTQSVFVALVVLAISAGAVFAGGSMSEASGAGLERAAAAAGRAVPSTADPAGQVAPAPTPTPTPTPIPTPTPTAPSAAITQPTGTGEEADATTGQHPDNHGAIVSAAAHLSFDDLDDLKTACAGFVGKNKGAYISAIARGELIVTLAAPVAAPAVTAPTTALETTAGTTGSVTADPVRTLTITCPLTPAPTTTQPTAAGTTAAAAATASPTASPTPTPTPATAAPAKLHGKANADARKADHGKPSH